MRILLVLLIVVISVISEAQGLFIAHRGASYEAPENTLASINLAWEGGVKYVEVDVRLSSDQRVMVIHDRTTKRTSKEKVKLVVSETHSEDLRKLDVGFFKGDHFQGEQIPFLEEVLETIPQNDTLVIEIKTGPEILPALETILMKSGKLNQIIFTSFHLRTLTELKSVFPDNHCYYLKMFSLKLKEDMKMASRSGIDGINLHHKNVNRKVLRRARRLHLDVMAWTINDPKTAQKLYREGVSGITTNRPVWLKEQIGDI